MFNIKNLERNTLIDFVSYTFIVITTLLIFTALGFLYVNLCFATPSTTYWSPCVFDIQPYGVLHIGVDNYTTIGKKGPASGGQGFPTDFGLTIGVLPLEKIKMEVGIDLLEPSDDPLYFNAKVGTPENILFDEAPAVNIGIFNIGTKKDVTDYNIFDFIIGKTLPFNLGRLHSGYYIGSNTLKDSSGNVDNKGFMLGYDKYVYKDIIMFAADYASGKNAVGGGGIGLYFFFTSNISLLVGPVWFNDSGINGDTKWTSQLDINL